MRMSKRWTIRSVPDSVVEGFRFIAFDSGCTIAECLTEAYNVWTGESVIVEENEDDDEIEDVQQEEGRTQETELVDGGHLARAYALLQSLKLGRAT